MRGTGDQIAIFCPSISSNLTHVQDDFLKQLILRQNILDDSFHRHNLISGASHDDSFHMICNRRYYRECIMSYHPLQIV